PDDRTPLEQSGCHSFLTAAFGTLSRSAGMRHLRSTRAMPLRKSAAPGRGAGSRDHFHATSMTWRVRLIRPRLADARADATPFDAAHVRNESSESPCQGRRFPR